MVENGRDEAKQKQMQRWSEWSSHTLIHEHDDSTEETHKVRLLPSHQRFSNLAFQRQASRRRQEGLQPRPDEEASEERGGQG